MKIDSSDQEFCVARFRISGSITVSVIDLFDKKTFNLPTNESFDLPRANSDNVGDEILGFLNYHSRNFIGELLDLLDPNKHFWKSIPAIRASIKGTTELVDFVTKKVEDRDSSSLKEEHPSWRGLHCVFGGSAFIIDFKRRIVLGYICGGIAGKKLHNENYTINEFGPLVTVKAISSMAHEIHKHLKSCVDAQKYETKEQQGEDVQGASQELFENLKSLKKKANNLSKTLTIVADEVMTVSDLYVSVIQSRIILKWFMYNPDKNTYYTEDNGDIEYHVKILAICVDKKNKFEKVTICDDIFTFNDVNRLTKESTDDMPQAKVETLQESTSLGATSEKKQISFHKPKKCIQLVTRFKCSTLKRLVCVNVCIQAKVSIQVKMLSPDKIVEDTIKGGTDPFGTAWMGRTKKQIENSGRLLDVTISGKMMSKQHIPKISLDSTSFHEFTTDHKLSDKQLEVTCILTPVSGAEMYLVQLIDTTDLTVIIEQGLVKQTRSSQIQIKHDIVAKYGMFPETSSGPYCVSILPLTRGEVALSPFVESSLKIVRYNSPELLSVELPNLDQSETDVKLNWKHPELTFNGDHLFDLTILAYAVKSRKIQNQSTETEEEKLKHPDIKRKEPLFKGKNLLFKHPVKDLPKSNTIDVQYQFNLSDLLAKYNPRHQNGILFCCKIFAKSKPKGVIFKEISQLQSMPKYFPDFILLAPPTNMKVVTRKRNAGLHISWDYGTHAIGYRLEMVVTKSRKKEFLKEFKCTIGGRGQAVLYRSDFKNIPCTSVDSSYELRMYSLGLGEDLIRCLKPSVVKNPDKMHVVPAQLGYIQGEKVIRITFGFTNQSVVKAAATAIAALITSETTQTYTVELYQTLNVMDKPSFLLTKNVRKSSDGEIVIDFPLDTIHSKLQSGSMISAWVYSWTNAKKAIYVGVPQEEVLVLKSPTLKTSFTYHIDGSIHQMKVLWSGIPGAIVYEYGFCLRDKIIKKTTDATQVLIDFTLTEYRRELVQSLLESNSDWQQCQLYVTALGQPKQLLIGALTMDVHTLNCLIIPSSKRFIVFNTSMLQNIWTWFYTNPINLTLVHCISKQKRYLIYPSKDPYPNDPFPSS